MKTIGLLFQNLFHTDWRTSVNQEECYRYLCLRLKKYIERRISSKFSTLGNLYYMNNLYIIYLLDISGS